MVEENKPLLDDDFLIETLDNLPRISVPNTMLPHIMEGVMDEHIRSQVRTVLFPLYVFGLGIIFVALSLFSPSDLSWAQFLNLVFSSSDSGVWLYFQDLYSLCHQLMVREDLRYILIEGFAVFILILGLIGGSLLGIRWWVRWLHRSGEEPMK